MKPNLTVNANDEVIAAAITGRCKLDDVKAVVEAVVRRPEYSQFLEVLFDLREADCFLSVPDIHELTRFAAWPGNALPSCRRVAVVMPESSNPNHVRLFISSARDRGLSIRSFSTMAEACNWMQTDSIPALEP